MTVPKEITKAEYWTVGELRAYLNQFDDDDQVTELYLDVAEAAAAETDHYREEAQAAYEAEARTTA